MASCVGPAKRLKSRVSPNTAMLGLNLLRVANVAENVVGAPLDGSDSSRIKTVRGNGAATAGVNIALTASDQTINSARISS